VPQPASQSLPADATTNTPAARSALTAGNSALASHLYGRAAQELLITCAPNSGFPSRSGSPFLRKWGQHNCMQSRYRAGLPRLRPRFTQPIHCDQAPRLPDADDRPQRNGCRAHHIGGGAAVVPGVKPVIVVTPWPR
jgi:hypothetical protein